MTRFLNNVLAGIAFGMSAGLTFPLAVALIQNLLVFP